VNLFSSPLRGQAHGEPGTHLWVREARTAGVPTKWVVGEGATQAPFNGHGWPEPEPFLDNCRGLFYNVLVVFRTVKALVAGIRRRI
jgi:hypothetical protein